jgi:hypothetical protein
MKACGGAVLPVDVNMVLGLRDGCLMGRRVARRAREDQTRRNAFSQGGRTAHSGETPGTPRAYWLQCVSRSLKLQLRFREC